MKHRFAPDQQDPFGDTFGPAWDDLNFQNFLPPARQEGFLPTARQEGLLPPTGQEGGGRSPATPVVPTPALSNEAVEAQGAQTGPTSTVVVTNGGMTFDLIFDAAATAAPASFRAGIVQAASLLSAAVSNKITVNLQIDYSGTGGGAAAGPDAGQYVNYSTVRSYLIANAAPGDATFNALPTGSAIQGQSQVAVWNAQLKLFGLLSPNSTTTDDGSATFATDINSSLLVGVALHELTHALGRIPYGSQPDIFDFYRFTSPGIHLFTQNIPASSSYFSLNGGITKIADYGVSSDPSDFLNSGVQGSSDPYDEYYSNGTTQTLTGLDKVQLDALGFNTVTASKSIAVAATASEAVQGGAAVVLLGAAPAISDSSSPTLASATIKIANASGSAVAGDKLYVNGIQSGSLGNGVTASWNASTDTLTLTGSASLAVYDTLLSQVTYQDTGTDASTGSHPVRTVTWSANDGTASFNTTSQITVDRAPVVTAANAASSVGFTTVAASSLFTASDPDGDTIATYAVKDTGAGHFLLNGVTQANNQEIDVTAAQLSHLTYQNAIGTDTLQIRVNDGLQWSTWQSFTVTGPVATVFETFGSTSLVAVGGNLYLDSNGSGPELNINGAAIASGQSGMWTPNGVEQTPSGYEVAWKAAGADFYMIWNTDSNGTYVSSVQGTGTAIESYETSFHQDLNGDGVIGVQGTVIESFGSTSLVAVGGYLYLDNNSSGSGPELNINGTAIASGQSGMWTPNGVEQITGGYEVAWKATGVDFYMIWKTNSNGTYVSSVQGTGAAIQTYETSFQQDINGDGVIGIHGTVIESSGSTSLVKLGTNFYLDSNGSGPELNINGAAIASGLTGMWTPIGVEQITGGYEVAWKATGVDFYMIWNTDSNGTYVSNVQGTGTAIESYETGFQQDINGDGFIGIHGTVIESFGSTSLVELGTNFYLDSNGAGPELNINGTAIASGQTGMWMPIGVEQTQGGYEMAWKATGADLYMIWNTDSNGTYVSSVQGPGTAIESYETSFHQDLNGDGVIGIPGATAPQSGTAQTATVAAGATLELTAASSGSVTFDGTTGTLKLDDSAGFTGQILDFTGTGILASSDQIDLGDIDHGAVGFTDSYANGVLTVSDGTNTAHLSFAGTYSQDNFKFADDGHGGTIVYDPPAGAAGMAATIVATSSGQTLTGTGSSDTFVFNTPMGHATITNFQPASDVIDINHALFASVQALLAAAQNDGHGDVIITADAQDTITLQHVTLAQLQAHDGGFHIT
jgi:serralysin